MAHCKRNSKKLGYFLPQFVRYGLIGLLSVVLLSESVGAKGMLAQLQIAQQSAPTPSVPLSAEKQKRYQEGVKLVKEGQDLNKKGTKEGYHQAIEKYQQALKISQELGLRLEEAEINQNIGGVYFLLSDNNNALSFFKQALTIWEELNQPVDKAVVEHLVGNAYTSIGEYNTALEYYQKAELFFRKKQDFFYLSRTLKMTSQAYIRLGNMDKALNSLNQVLEICRNSLKDSVCEANTLNSIGFLYSQKLDSKAAFENYHKALEIHRKNKDLSGQTESLREIAALMSKLGKDKEALQHLEEALQLLKGKNAPVQQGLILDGIGDVYSSSGDFQKAINYHKQSRILFYQAGAMTLESLTIGTIISIYRNFIGDYQQALIYIEEALTLDRKAGDKEQEASTLNKKGDIYIRQGDYQLALDAYNQALEIERSITQNPRAEARTLRNIALLYNFLGDNKLCISNYNQALNIYRKLDNKKEQAITLNYIGNIYQSNRKFDEALESYYQALGLFNKEDYQFEIVMRWGLAKTYRDKNDYFKAFEAANRALELSKQYNYSFQETASIGIIGSIYLAEGDYKNALDNYAKALVSYRKTGLLNKEAETLNTISIAYSSQKEYQQAIDILNKELKIRRFFKDIQGEADALYSIAKNQRKLENLETAITNIEEAIKIVENIRGNVKNQDLRTSYFATVQGYYKFYIDLLMELDEKNPGKKYDELALNASERSRARGLLDLLEESNAKIRKGANPQLLQQERNLLQQINARETQRQNLENTPSQNDLLTKAFIQRLTTETENLLTQYRELQAKIRTSSPEYAALKYPEPLELKQIQQQLDKDTILLQYSLGKDRSYLWAVTPDSMNAYELPAQKQIEDAANNFQDVMLSGGTPFGKDNPDAINKPASQLSQIILAPVADKLGKKRLVIVADGVLQNIPFAALADPEAGQLNKSSNSYQPLLVNHEIVNLPSITALATHRQQLKNRQPAPKTLAVLADPVFTADDERVTGKKPALAPELNLNPTLQLAIKNLNRNEIPRLEGTRKEAEAILKLVSPSQSLHAYDFDANYNFVNSKELKQYRYLLFATHGIVDTTNPELSGIVLSQIIDKQGKPVKNGYLRLGDIFNLDLGAELVVLSACETGLGKDVKGEGLMGLTRGLMYAGSKRAVVSLWQVDDAGTSQLMPLFYKSVLAGESPTSALRAAQLQLWQQKQWQNPYYWAAFTLQGEWR